MLAMVYSEWLMWLEILLVFILLKFKKRPNISRIRVCTYTFVIFKIKH